MTPVIVFSEVDAERFEPPIYDEPHQLRETIAEIGRLLWHELFTVVKTESQLTEWESKIPRYECDCSNFYHAWKSENPPSFPLSIEWKWRLKTAVNEKLQKPNLSLEEVRLLFDSAESIET